jgi:hypothetical protein
VTTNLPVGTYTVSVVYATGTASRQLTVTTAGPNTTTFTTIAVSVNVIDPVAADIAAATVQHAGSSGTFSAKTAVDANGQLTFEVLPGTSSFTAWVAGGYQTQTVAITAAGPNLVFFVTAPVTVNVVDPVATDTATATVQHAGNTGAFGGKTPVDSNGQVVFQALPGTSSFTAWVAGGYQTQTVVVSALGLTTVTFTTVPVTVQVVDANGNPRTSATVQHAGNTGAFGGKTPVDSNGQVVFQALPGTSSFTAWAGSAYRTVSLSVTAPRTVVITV